MTLEAALLTGGASRRMGEDKAGLVVDGEPLGRRLVRLLTEVNIPVTVLGREPLPGASFLADAETFYGPLAALSRFQPFAEAVFVLSCDLPRFDPLIPSVLAAHLVTGDAVVPVVGGRRQPLCALYKASSFAKICEAAKPSMMAWLDLLHVVEVTPAQLGIEPECMTGANTPEEFQEFLNR